jgi:uncharacterized membrane protein YcaP (DUF421 family)
MRQDRLTLDELESEMRLAGIGRMSDVAWAIIEPRGKISFIKRDAAGGDDASANDDDSVV